MTAPSRPRVAVTRPDLPGTALAGLAERYDLAVRAGCAGRGARLPVRT
jgi:hypothetical protein